MTESLLRGRSHLFLLLLPETNTLQTETHTLYVCVNICIFYKHKKIRYLYSQQISQEVFVITSNSFLQTVEGSTVPRTGKVSSLETS